MGCPNTSFITGYVLITFFSVAALGVTPIAIIGADRTQGYTTLIAAETVLAISILAIIVRESTLCCGARPARAGGKVANLCARPFSVGGSGLNVCVIGLHTLALVLMIAGLVQACNYYSALCNNYRYNGSYWSCDNYGSTYIFVLAFGVPPIIAVAISLALLCWLACPCCDAAQQDNSQVEQKALETRIEMEVVARVQAQLQAAVQQIGQQQQQQVMAAVLVQSYLPAGQGHHVVGYVPQWSTQQPSTPINSAFLAGDAPSEQYNYGGEGMVGETQPDN